MSRKWVPQARTALVLIAVLFGYTIVFDSAFELWQSQFRQFAIAQGIQPATVDMAMRGLLPDDKVLRLDALQPEFSKNVWEYVEGAASTNRIIVGQRRMQEYQPLLNAIYAKYGVQPEYLVAIWGLESDFGRFTGRYNIIRSLATYSRLYVL